VEASALQHTGAAGIHGRSPLLRLQSDERLIALVRRGNQHAFEALVGRYQARLLAFCRHMLSSREDAEDVLQEVFAAAYNAILGDDREINVRPWLYRIARNRSLNHLRKATAIGVDSMDVHLSEGGLTTADKVHKREEFRQLVADVQDLPETQKTALLLREIDALSYEQIAEAMDTTVPSVKSLLVRARVGLAEAAEARLLTCAEVRDELGEVAEGLRRTTAPVRRHLRTCERCSTFRKQLRQTNKALAALFPIGPLFLLKKSLLAHLGTTAAAGGGTAAAAGGGAAVAGATAGGALQAGLSTLATKAAAGLAAAAIVTAGAVEVKHAAEHPRAAGAGSQLAQVSAAPSAPAQHTAPVPLAATPQPVAAKPDAARDAAAEAAEDAPAEDVKAADQLDGKPAAGADGQPAANVEQHEGDTTVLPSEMTGSAGATGGALGPQPAPAAQPTTTAGSQPAPAPQPQPAATPSPTVLLSPAPGPAATPEATPTPAPATTPQPEATPQPETEPTTPAATPSPAAASGE
jgi:RNA polymerase sigma factor (sigma-70 family)